MTATPKAYRTPYVSQMIAEPDRSWDDCCASVTIMLGNDWTLGEWSIRDDGRPWDLHVLRNVIRKRIGDTDGGLTLHDANDMLHELDPELPPLPRYGGQKHKPGQSTDGATLRLDRAELMALLRSGHSAAICGLSGTVGHVIHVTDGTDKGVLRKDPLTRRKEGWPGDRITWDELWRFTEAKVGGKRAFGSPDAIACAVVRVGAETQAARAERQRLSAVARLNDKVAAQRAQTELATEERNAARVEARLATEAAAGLRAQLTAAQARVKELEGIPTPDCVTQVNAERARVLDLLSDRFDDLLAEVR